jgi:hypothetical protein
MRCGVSLIQNPTLLQESARLFTDTVDAYGVTSQPQCANAMCKLHILGFGIFTVGQSRCPGASCDHQLNWMREKDQENHIREDKKDVRVNVKQAI